jgi:hypothetical protein
MISNFSHVLSKYSHWFNFIIYWTTKFLSASLTQDHSHSTTVSWTGMKLQIPLMCVPPSYKFPCQFYCTGSPIWVHIPLSWGQWYGLSWGFPPNIPKFTQGRCFEYTDFSNSFYTAHSNIDLMFLGVLSQQHIVCHYVTPGRGEVLFLFHILQSTACKSNFVT